MEIEALYYDAIPIIYEVNKSQKFYPRLDENKIGFIKNDTKSLIKVIEKLIINKKKLIQTRNMIKTKKTNFFDKNMNKNIDSIIKKEIYKIYNNMQDILCFLRYNTRYIKRYIRYITIYKIYYAFFDTIQGILRDIQDI